MVPSGLSGSLAINVQVSLRGGLLPVESLSLGVLGGAASAVIFLREDIRRLAIRLLSDPGLVTGKVDGHADALGVVEDSGVDGHVGERGAGVLLAGFTEDGVETGLWMAG